MTRAHLAAMLAFTLWGLFPLYWKLFSELDAWNLFAHRLFWSFVSLMLFMGFRKKLGVLPSVWRNTKLRWMLISSALLISSNWLLYIYAVNSGQVLEASMGYFLNPLINVFMGWVLLNERLRPTQWPSIFLALLAILLIGIQTDLAHIPWLALFLSITFALYGLVRKLAKVNSLEGLFFETCVVIVPTMLYWCVQAKGPLTALHLLTSSKFLLLTLSGLVTCVPLVLFAYSARRLTLQSLGFIQYLSPSFKFMCALFILREPLSPARLQAFTLIWIALAWYTIESLYFVRKKAAPTALTEI